MRSGFQVHLRASRKTTPASMSEQVDCAVIGAGEPAQDFTFSGPADHGIRGLVNLFGIEAPGLTSTPAIADHVANLLN
jgi:hypothetical protein